MCLPNLGVRVLGNTPAFACAYYVNACRRAPQRRVRGKELCSCDKSDATRLLQLLWIRSLPCLSSLQAITCKVRLKHTYTHVHTHVSHKSMCNTILVPRAARVGPSTTPLHTLRRHPPPPVTCCARVRCVQGSCALRHVRQPGSSSRVKANRRTPLWGSLVSALHVHVIHVSARPEVRVLACVLVSQARVGLRSMWS